MGPGSVDRHVVELASDIEFLFATKLHLVYSRSAYHLREPDYWITNIYNVINDVVSQVHVRVTRSAEKKPLNVVDGGNGVIMNALGLQ